MNESWYRYGEVIKRGIPWIGVTALAAGIITAALLRNWGPSYDMHFSYVVSLGEREESEAYTFDGYYALQATDLFVASLAKWTVAPEMVARAYEVAGLEQPRSARVLAQAVKSEKTAPQIVQVTVTSKNQAEVERLTAGVQEVVQQNIDNYNQDGLPLARFQVMTTEQWLGQQEVAAGVTGIAVGLVVLFLLINAVLLRESWRQMVESEQK